MIEKICKIKDSSIIKIHEIIDINCEKIITSDNKVVLIMNTQDKNVALGIELVKDKIKIVSNSINIDSDKYDKLCNICDCEDYVVQSKEKIENFINVNNFEVIIENISDYIEFTCSLFENNVLFRGQSDCSWDLKPSIFRKENNNKTEESLYKDIKQWNDEEFSSDSYIENLCNMQHYGIPTRLVDWTSNPLHALYFATVNESAKDKDGSVCCVEIDKIYDEDTPEYSLIEEYFKNRIVKNDEINMELIKILDTQKENYFFIRTKYYNKRIKNQQGFFSIYIDITDDESIRIKQIIWNNIKEEIFKVARKSFQGYKENRTEDIKVFETVLSKRGFPPDKANEIYQYYCDKYGRANLQGDFKSELLKIFSNCRLDIADNIHPKKHDMGKVLTNQPVINIKISKDLKNELAKKLDIIGINSRIIYPDTQGLSMYMREKYL